MSNHDTPFKKMERKLFALETELAAALAANQRLEKERDEATDELIRVCHALECTAQEARSISSRADGIMRSWKESKSEVAKRDERIATLVESWNDEHRESCQLRAQVASLTALMGCTEAALKNAVKGIDDLTAERDRLIADVVQYRRALEKIRTYDSEALRETMLLWIRDEATEALATEHPGAPLVDAVAKAVEALKHAAAIFARYVKIHADKHTPEGDAKAIANYLAHTECMEALALLAPFAPKVDQSTESA